MAAPQWHKIKGPDGKRFGERLADLRNARGLNQPDLKKELLGGKKDATTVSKWETGDEAPGLVRVLALVRFFDVSAHWLLTGEGSQLPDPGEAEEKLAAIRKILDEPVSPPAEDEKPERKVKVKNGNGESDEESA